MRLRPKAIGILSRLKAATGNEVSQDTTPDGLLRLEVSLPAEMNDTARDMLLGALDDANDYGHVRSSKSERVWATVEDWGEL